VSLVHLDHNLLVLFQNQFVFETKYIVNKLEKV